jgi:hypothetical protein
MSRDINWNVAAHIIMNDFFIECKKRGLSEEQAKEAVKTHIKEIKSNQIFTHHELF